MTPPHCTQPAEPSTDPFRWPTAEVVKAHDHFAAPDRSSQRQYAQQTGIPRSPLGYWARRDDPADDDPQLHPDLVSFLRTSVGAAFLRRLVLAALTTFCLQGA